MHGRRRGRWRPGRRPCRGSRDWVRAAQQPQYSVRVGAPRLDRVAQGVHERGVAAELHGLLADTPTVGRLLSRAWCRGRRTPASSAARRTPRPSAARCRRGTGRACRLSNGPPRRGTSAPVLHTGLGTDDSPGSASGTASPPSSTVGTPDAFRACEPVLPGPLAAQQPDDGEGSAPSSSAGSSVSTCSVRVADPVVGTGGAGRQQIRVGGRQQQHCAHAGAPVPGIEWPCGAPDSMSRHSASVLRRAVR